MRNVVAVVCVVLAAAAGRAGDPVVAVLDPGKSDRVALLEAKLAAEPGVTLVERSAVDAVLKEQELQAAFGPQGVGQRVRLGAVLKADVLVLVRPAKEAKEPVLDVVVSETAGGLRLLRRAVPADNDAEAGAAGLRAAVRDGLRKHRETVRQVVAVPPFVSRDLGFDTDHLKAAFARVAEAAADRPGVVAVELAEADAVAAELRLAAPGARVARPLPTYLLGQYRHDGAGADRTVTLTLRAERGGKPAATPLTQTVASDKAAGAVRGWAAAAAGTPADALAAADPKAEAKQLADRATDFRRLGEWDESLALADASLLLDPNQPEMHAVALKALCPPLRQAWIRSFEPGNPEKFERLYLRGLPHLEALFLSGDVDRTRGEGGADIVMDFRVAANGLAGLNGTQTAEAAAHLEAARAADRAMAMRILPVVAKRNSSYGRVIAGWAVKDLPMKERHERMGDIVFSLADLPGARARTVSYVCRGYVTPPDADTPEFQALLDRLVKSDKPDLRDAAADLTKKVAAAKAAAPFKHSTIDPPDPTAPGPGGVAFAPLAMRFDPPQRFARPGDKVVLSGVLPVGPQADVFWSGAGLYLMREKGILRTVWQGAGNDGMFGFSTVSFDGRYVWATLPRYQTFPYLLVLDPETGKVADLSAAAGLPQPPKEAITATFATPALAAAPVSPGKACVVGGVFGRSWAAVVTFDGRAGTAKVFHEAREASDRTKPDQWKSTAVAFAPTFAFTIRDPAGGGGCRVVVGRGGGENLGVWDHPLAIDPDRAAVEVVPERVWAWPTQRRCAAAVDAIYFVEPQLTQDRKRHLARIGYPRAAKEVVATGMPYSDGQFAPAVVHDGRVHLIISQSSVELTDKSGVSNSQNTRNRQIDQWWSADLDGKNLRRVATDLQPVGLLGTSAHYGLVAFLGHPRQNYGEPHAVSFPKPAPGAKAP